MSDIVHSKTDRLTFFVGVNTGFANDGEPDTRLVEFYKRRSSPSLHCAIVGNVVIPGGYASNGNTPVISRSPIWRNLAKEIASGSVIPGIQLSTAWSGYVGSRRFRSPESARTIDDSRRVVEGVKAKEVSALFDSLQDGFQLAFDAGFRHIQLHAAHGYLFSLLVDDRIFQSAGEIRAKLETVTRLWSLLGAETSIRISLKTGDLDFDKVGNDTRIENLVSLIFDYVDVSSGFYNIDKRLIYPSTPCLLAERRRETLEVARKYPNQKFIYSGRAMNDATRDLPPNVHLGLCRDLIANPDFLDSRGRGCVNSGKCHYFSRGEKHLTCSQWRGA